METCMKDGEEKHHHLSAYSLLPALQLQQAGILQLPSLKS